MYCVLLSQCITFCSIYPIFLAWLNTSKPSSPTRILVNSITCPFSITLWSLSLRIELLFFCCCLPTLLSPSMLSDWYIHQVQGFHLIALLALFWSCYSNIAHHPAYNLISHATNQHFISFHLIISASSHAYPVYSLPSTQDIIPFICPLQVIMHFMVLWFWIFYYVFSDDEEFPTYEEVSLAFENQDSGSKTESAEAASILGTCWRLFWLSPSSNLGAMMPGLLDDIDNAYLKTIKNKKGGNHFDPDNPQWNKKWKKYATSVVKRFHQHCSDSVFITIPPRAVAWFTYFIMGMKDFHSCSVFPTTSVICDIAEALKGTKLVFADVSHIPSLEWLQISNYCRSVCGWMGPWCWGLWLRVMALFEHMTHPLLSLMD